jgi:transposase
MYNPNFRNLVADTYLHTKLTLQQVADMYGLDIGTVSVWSKGRDSYLYSVSKRKNRQLLMALNILDVRPTIRADELASLVGVGRSTIDRWNASGKISLDIQCEICGEPTTTKYCTDCTDKGWHKYFNKFEITYEELKSLPTECEVCGATERLHVDHDHSTNKYRGVLCHQCNVALCMVSDDIDRLKNLIKYLHTNNNKDKQERNVLKILRRKYAY